MFAVAVTVAAPICLYLVNRGRQLTNYTNTQQLKPVLVQHAFRRARPQLSTTGYKLNAETHKNRHWTSGTTVVNVTLVAKATRVASPRRADNTNEGQHHNKRRIGSNARHPFSVPGAGDPRQHRDRGNQEQRSPTAAA